MAIPLRLFLIEDDLDMGLSSARASSACSIT